MTVQTRTKNISSDSASLSRRITIDLGCNEKERTLDEVKKMAFRFQMSQVDGTHAAHGGGSAMGGSAMGGSVSVTGAAISDDRLTSVEMALFFLTP